MPEGWSGRKPDDGPEAESRKKCKLPAEAGWDGPKLQVTI